MLASDAIRRHDGIGRSTSGRSPETCVTKDDLLVFVGKYQVTTIGCGRKRIRGGGKKSTSGELPGRNRCLRAARRSTDARVEDGDRKSGIGRCPGGVRKITAS